MMFFRMTGRVAMAAGLAVLVSSASALAQQAAPAAPAAPLTNAPNLSPGHLAVAIEVVKSSGMSRSIESIVPTIVDKARQLFVSMRPELAGEIDKSIKALAADFDNQRDEALKLAAYGFGNRLSEAELKEINTFFSSASGKKFVDSQPAILDEMFRNLDAFTERLSQFVVDKLRADMKAKGHTL